MLSLLTNNCFVRRGYLTFIVKHLKPNFGVRNKHTDPKMVLNSGEALLYHQTGDETFTLMLRFEYPNLRVDRQFNFNRRISETVDVFLSRVELNINRSLTAKIMKKKMLDNKSEILSNDKDTRKVFLYKKNVKINGDTICETIVQDVEDLKLLVFDRTYAIKKNMPMVTHIALPSSMLCGFPLYPSKFEAIYTDKKLSNFYWYKKHKENRKDQWEPIGNEYMYISNVSDIDYNLKICCIPKNEKNVGPPIQVESKGSVEAGPGPCPIDTRQAFTKDKLTGKSFRVTSYNILADTYASTSYSKENLFPYCPTYALDMDYRKQLILKEIIGFNADIMCLQEVDSKIYNNDFMPLLSTLRYKSIFNTKNESPEGLAIFFNEERFEELNSNFTVIGQNLNLPKFALIWSKINNEKMKQRFLNRNTITQVIALRSKETPSEILVIGNTHLYFHPDADHIRLLQAYYVLIYINQFVEQIQKEHPRSNVSIILCGDFNSSPDCGIYRLMTENFVPENEKDWKSNLEEAVENVSLTYDTGFASACGTPLYTNYTPDFSSCLDYIFYEKSKFEVEQVIPMPSEEELALHKGLPSIVFPSDHISLCADLKWIT